MLVSISFLVSPTAALSQEPRGISMPEEATHFDYSSSRGFPKVLSPYTTRFVPAPLSFAKTLADSEINDIAAAVPPAFCYNSWPCLN